MAKIISIKSLGLQEVFDITVEDHHNYIANGIVVHNCMKMAVVLAGFTPTESDHFRKGIKLKDPKKFKPWHDQFISGSKKYSGIEEEVAEKIWEFIQYFSGYGFGRAHAVTYALVSYITAYLKHYYPVEFMCGLLSNNVDDDDKLSVYLRECKRLKIKLLMPAINVSSKDFTIDGDSIRFPLTTIKGCGEVAVEHILTERENSKFKSFKDFHNRVERSKVRINNLINLTFAGVFDEFGTVEKNYDRLIRYREEKEDRTVYCPACKKRYPLAPKEVGAEFYVCNVCGEIDIYHTRKETKGKKFDKQYILDQVFGFHIGGAGLEEYAKAILKEECYPLSIIDEVYPNDIVRVAFEMLKIKVIKDRNDNEMAFLTITDGETEEDVVLFSSEWEIVRNDMKVGKCYICNLVKSARENWMFYNKHAELKILGKKK